MAKRILVLNERDLRNPLAGGAEVHTFEVFGRLAARGHEVTLLAASFAGGAREEIVEGVRVRRLANRYAYYALAPLAGRRAARREGYDIVVDVLCKLPFLSPWFTRVPCLAIVHHLFGETAFKQVSLPIALVTYLSEKLIPYAYRSTPIVAVSPSTAQDLVERGMAAPNISIVPCGIDHGEYTPGDGQRSWPPLVAWLGRLEPYKRVDLFLRAVAAARESVPVLRAIVVGDGSALAATRELAARLGLRECVEFPGYVDAAGKVELLRRAFALVNTSEKEGWGLTVLEGNACGTITIASDVPGLRDSVRDGQTGILVEHGDVEQLTSELLGLLEDRARGETLRAGAIEWAQRFTWDSVTDDIERIIHAVVAGAAPAAARIVSPVFADRA
jgi:glycosyltransferase involved in cell wall biosynthesis